MVEILKVDGEGKPKSHLKKAAEIIKNSGVIAYPTDTLYGLGVNPFDVTAIKKIFTIKEREETKPLLLLIAKEEEVYRLTQNVSPLAKKLMAGYWPGPLTMLFQASTSLPPILLGHSGKVGLRLPNNKIVLELLKLLGHPLTATSANKSGGKSPLTAAEVFEALGDEEGIDLILDGGPSSTTVPSTLIDVSIMPPLLIREGLIPFFELEKSMHSYAG